MATVVLPVLRSPMISSRWPRPIGVMASMALMPVCSGSFTGWRLDDARGLHLHAAGLGGGDGALAVERLAQGVDHPAEEGVADRHREDATGGLDHLLLLEAVDLAQDDGTDGLLVEVEGQAQRAVLELEDLVHRGTRAVP